MSGKRSGVRAMPLARLAGGVAPSAGWVVVVVPGVASVVVVVVPGVVPVATSTSSRTVWIVVGTSSWMSVSGLLVSVVSISRIASS
ncbi:MAG: hypothetical protein MK187_09665, partial [Acidimicrobiales bacterium]|nr:hypothetical protein [Acidimicrobiales bacterium]